MTSVRQQPLRGGRIRRLLPQVLLGVGLLALVTGTFLPWTASGAMLRNSYQSMAIAARLTPLGDGVTGVVLAAWPAVGGISAACLVLYLIGLRRIAACCVLLLAAVAGTVASLVVVLLPSGNATIGAVASGPVTTAAGAVLAAIGAVMTLARPANRRRGEQEERSELSQ